MMKIQSTIDCVAKPLSLAVPNETKSTWYHKISRPAAARRARVCRETESRTNAAAESESLTSITQA